MALKIDSEKLKRAFRRAPLSVARELRTELRRQLQIVQIDAQLHHRFVTKGGHAIKAIQSKVEKNGLSGKVFIGKGIGQYAVYQHEGTGIYGPRHRPYKVVPINSGALHFASGGREFLVPKNYFGNGKRYWDKAAKDSGAKLVKKGYVTIKGIKPDKFIYNAFDRHKNQIDDAMSGAVNRALVKAGVK